MLSIDELKKGLQLGIQINENDHQDTQHKYSYHEVIESFDFDGDGQINFNEFIAAASEKKTLINKDNAAKLFKMFDVDNDSVITADELALFFSQKTQGD